MKWLVLIVDGAAGWAVDALGGRTSLEAARTPTLDALVAAGTLGLANTVPKGMEPSSAIACMSVLGFDPRIYYAGRGPIEAIALGIDLEPGQVALRCNLVTVTDGAMRSYAAGHISSEESRRLIASLDEELGGDGIRFYPGVGFRHILVVDDAEDLVQTRCTPAHDIADQPVAEHLPQGPGAPLLVDLMQRSQGGAGPACREPGPPEEGRDGRHPSVALLAGPAGVAHARLQRGLRPSGRPDLGR